MNNWAIPNWLEKEVQERDKTCVYCGIKMIEQMPPRGHRRNVATWEHIINDAISSLVRILPDVASRAIQAKDQRSSLIGFSRVTARSVESTKIRLRNSERGIASSRQA